MRSVYRCDGHCGTLTPKAETGALGTRRSFVLVGVRRSPRLGMVMEYCRKCSLGLSVEPRSGWPRVRSRDGAWHYCFTLWKRIAEHRSRIHSPKGRNVNGSSMGLYLSSYPLYHLSCTTSDNSSNSSASSLSA